MLWEVISSMSPAYLLALSTPVEISA